MSDVFGNIIDGDQVEIAVLDTLKFWFKTYLEELEFQRGGAGEVGNMPEPKSWITVNELDRFPEDQLPCIIVVSPGLNERPLAEGDGSYRAPFGVGVAVVASASDQAATRKIVRRYSAVIRAILVQKASLGGFADGGTVWDDEAYDDLPVEDERTIGVGQVTFTVWVSDVASKQRGPSEPVPPGTGWPLVETHEEIIEVKDDEP